MKNNNVSVFLFSVLILIFLVLILIFFNNKKDFTEELLNIDFSNKGNLIKLDKYKTKNPVVAFYIKGYGSVVIELYPDIAPNTVNNFISLVSSGFYDNNTFHRLVPGFVLQGGDKEGTGMGGAGYRIEGEFNNNGFKNELKHEKGVVSMARSQDKNSAGSQFFIMLDDNLSLDGEYAAFGKVIDGFKIIKRIEKYEKVIDSNSGKLNKNLTIIKGVVDLKEKNYDEPKKVS